MPTPLCLFVFGLFVLVMVLPAYAEKNTVTMSTDASAPGCEQTLTCYDPYEIKIKKGQTVHWKNTGSVMHSVASGTSDAFLNIFDSGVIASGTGFLHTFYESGKYPYFCMFYPWMKGIVTVADDIYTPEQKTASKTMQCKNPKAFFTRGIITTGIFEDFEEYCLYAKGSQDENFSYEISLQKEPENAMYGIRTDVAKGQKSLMVMLSVDRAREGDVSNYGAVNNGDLHVASFLPHLHMLSADVYSEKIQAGSSGVTAGSTTKVIITYDTKDDKQKAIIITPNYVGNRHNHVSTMAENTQTKIVILDNGKGQMSWKNIKYDIKKLYNQNDFGNYDSDVTRWSLSVGGESYTSSLGIASWSITLDNLIVSDGITTNHIPSPSYQHTVGISPQDITCQYGRELAFRISDAKPICINSSSMQKIFNLNYAVPSDISDDAFAQKIASDKDYFVSLLTKHTIYKEPVTATDSIEDVLQYIDNANKKKEILNKLASYRSNVPLDRNVFSAWPDSSLEEFATGLERGSTSDFGESSGIFMTPSESQIGSITPHVGDEPGFRLEYTDAGREFSTTNLHVLEVDEPDFVKNNVDSIYVLSNEDDVAVIDAHLLGNLELLSETSPHTDDARYFLLYQDRLVILSDVYQGTEITILDVSVTPPAKIHQLALDAPLYKARMIGDTIYVMTNTAISDDTKTPQLYDMINSDVLSFRSMMYYFAENLYADTLHTVTAIKMHKNGLDVDSSSFVLGWSDTTYISKNNIYFSNVQKYSGVSSVLFDDGIIFDYAINHMDSYYLAQLYGIASDLGSDDDMIKDQMLSLVFSAIKKQDRQAIRELLPEDAYDMMFNTTPQTAIHKIAVDETDIKYVTSGSVKGTLLNQFALDQKDDALRVVTSFRQDGLLQSNVYVLDDTLKLTDSLEGIAPGETLHSTRFAGDWLYLVTFRQVDPFFVIDVSTDTPKILGELKIPGYSKYLQNYDDGHVIGIGRDTNRDQWNQTADAGIKISMFDVTDFENPKEVDSVIIGDHSTGSAGLVEHKSLLIDDNKKIISMPITFGGELFFYVYIINDDYTLQEHSKIPHKLDVTRPQDMRSLYIGDTLYTVTPAMVKASSLLKSDTTLDSILLGLE